MSLPHEELVELIDKVHEARVRAFGTDGEELLVRKYNELYWELNEYQLCGITQDLYESYVSRMAKIVKILGYTPES